MRKQKYILFVILLFVTAGIIVGSSGFAMAVATDSTVVSPDDTDGDGNVEVRSNESARGPSTVRVNVTIGTTGNNATFTFDEDGDFGTTNDQGVNGTANVTIADGGTGDLDGSENGEITTDLVVDGGSSVDFTEADSFVLGINESTTVGNETTISSLTIDNTAPSISDIETRDNGQASGTVIDGTNNSAPAANNGQIDQLTVTLSENVSDGTVSTADFNITGFSIDSITTGASADDDTIVLDLRESGTGDTDATPTVNYTQGSLADEAGNLLGVTTKTPTDGAAPAITAAATADTNANGNVNQINITHSEPINDSSSTLDGTTFSLSSGSADDLNTGATVDDNATRINASGLTGTAATPDVTLNASKLQDSAGNSLSGSQTFSSTVDGAAPAITAATTADRNTNGNVSRINVTLSEATSDSSSILDETTFSLSSGSADDSNTGATTDDGAAQINVSGLTGTAARPDVILNASKLQDSAGNALSGSQTFTGTTDGAAPAITTATTANTNGDNSVNRIDVTLSEAIDDSSSTLDGTTFSLSSGSVDDSNTGATTDDDTTRITISGLTGTTATPDVTLSAGKLRDSAGNALGGSQTFTGTTDGAAEPDTGAGSGGRSLSQPGSPSDRIDSAKTLVLGSESAALSFSSGGISRVTVSSSARTTGTVQITTLSRLPDRTRSPSNRLVQIAGIQVPDQWGQSGGTVEISVRSSAVDVSPDRLRIEHYDEATDTWETLETDVTQQTESTITIGGETRGFSLFAVTAVDITEAQPTATSTATPASTSSVTTGPTPTVTPTEIPAEPETESSTTGFGPIVAVLTLLATVFALQRHRRSE